MPATDAARRLLNSAVKSISKLYCIGLEKCHYFKLGNVDDLRDRIVFWASRGTSVNEKTLQKNWIKQRYDWLDIAKRTVDVYESVSG